jgi:aspartate racemase
MKRILGVLGGMGPLATVDFMRKVIELTPVSRDQDHVPLIVYSIPQVPDRTQSILGDGESPLPVMLEGLRVLENSGVGRIAIPCNTAHHWFDAMARECGVELLHIADCACAALERRGGGEGPVGLLSTAGTIAAGIYQNRLLQRGYDCLVPDAADMETLVSEGIRLVKAGKVDDARTCLGKAAANLRRRGARTIVLGCTEIPVALDDRDAGYVDATEALAEAGVRWYFDQPGN